MEPIVAAKVAVAAAENKGLVGKIILGVVIAVAVPFLLIVCCFAKLLAAFTPDGALTSSLDVTQTAVYKSVVVATEPFYKDLWDDMTKKEKKIMAENTKKGQHYETINGKQELVSDTREMAIVTRKMNYLGDAYFVAYLTCQGKIDFETASISSEVATNFLESICEVTVTEKDTKKFEITNTFLDVDEIAEKYFETDAAKEEFKASCYSYSQFFDISTAKIEVDVGNWRSEDEVDVPTIGSTMNMPLYLQYQGDWSSVTYGNGVIKNTGCCPTCLAMVLSYLKKENIYPDDVAAWAGNKYYVNGQGTSWGIFGAVYAKWGVKCTNISKNQMLLLQALKQNKPVIASMGPGKFTKGGHFIVLSGITSDGKIRVNDPNDSALKNHINTEFELSLIMRESKNMWVCEVPK